MALFGQMYPDFKPQLLFFLTRLYNFHFQTKKIHCSVIASKNRVETAKSEYQNKLNKAADSLVTADVTYTKKSLKKLELVIDEASLTGKKDEKYSEYLDYQKSKITEYKRDIEDVQLKIDIEKHRKIVEETKPSVKKGLDKLKQTKSIQIVDTINQVNSNNLSFLILNYIKREPETIQLWENFGIQLNKLHQTHSNSFGLDTPNYIGSIPQINNWCATWSDFYV